MTRHTGHAGLDEYLARHRLTGGDPRTDGAVVLVFDDQYRVYCRPAQHGDLVFEIRVTEMPDEERRSDDLLYEALEFTGERLGEADEVPVLSDDGRTRARVVPQCDRHLAPAPACLVRGAET